MLIGVDFTGGSILAGLVAAGQIERTAGADLPARLDPDETLALMARLVRSLALQPSLVGLAIPGEVDADGRCWRMPNFSGFEGVALAERLGELVGCPVAVENRATAAALAERLFGHGRQHPNLLLVTLGTGIGGGLVLGHQLYPGTNGFGAELGHLKVDYGPDAPLCGCGQRGCLEAFAGARAILRRYRTLAGVESDSAELVTSARSGEPCALQVLDGAGRALGRALANAQNLLDLNAIVLACGKLAPFDLLTPAIRRELRQLCCAPPLVNVALLESRLGEHAAVLGAAYLMQL